MPRNIEIKVGCTGAELATIRGRLAERSLHSIEKLRQTDVYFRVASGRLKLRTIEPNVGVPTTELIQYQRADDAGTRVSTYRRVAIALNSAVELELALSDSLGVFVTVHKVRSVAVCGSTRIHLDDVEGLGHFVELETVLGNDLPVDAGRAELAEVVQWLGLAALTPIPGSYSDLMLTKG